MAMTYQRQEGFRFVFSPPLRASLEIVHTNGGALEISPGGEGFILDLSLKGAKIAVPYELPIDKNKGSMNLRFEINGGNLVKANGEIIWKSKQIRDYHYGILFVPSSYSPDMLLQEIKYYAKKHRK